MTTPNKRKSPGRPRGASSSGSDPRQALIDTAARLFGERGYSETSLKEVAAGAHVTPAMIAYYFKDKPGLLEAVAVHGFEKMIEALEVVATGDDEGAFVPRFVTAYLHTINAHPWIPQILVREVVSRDTPLRQLFIDRFAQRALELIPPRVIAEIESGRLRQDLDFRYTMLSLLGMCVFPFIAQPVLGPLLGYEFDATFGEEYTAHTVKLFLEGAAGESG